MKKLTLLMVMFTITCTSVFAQITREQSVAEWKRAKAYTKAYLDAMPADGYSFKATPEVRTFAQQMLHLTDATYYFISAASGKASPIGKVSVEKTVAQTKEATTKAVMDGYDFAISTIEGMTDADMSQPASAEGVKATKGLILAKAFEHQTHHRGQTTVYLRLKGVTPPGEMLF
ncbi:DinB family protein [Mucilaginibacter sp. UR6-11]|uniref:DinB family protein n=1 Tax=Mucilaginibacter sp. UR6-11 TaxID=1435644 RepID=UPI001E48B569|nr:DinB family protein [Mucilaginibacter sp. UR6-11]MCC8427011.1 DinB family protein [Mucilaginibacter sp. UR6-11]